MQGMVRILRQLLVILVLAQVAGGGIDHCGFTNVPDRCCGGLDNHSGSAKDDTAAQHLASCCAPMVFLAPQAIRLIVSVPVRHAHRPIGPAALAGLGFDLLRPPIA